MSRLNGAYCLVSREYPPFSGGGIGTYAEAFARGLAERGDRVVVLTAHADAAKTDMVETGGEPITVVRMPLQADEAWSAPHPSLRSKRIDRAWHRLGPHSVFAIQVAQRLPELHGSHGFAAVEGPDTGAPLHFLLERRRHERILPGVPIVTHVHSPSAWIERLNRTIDPRPVMHELQRMEAAQAHASDAVVTPSHGMSDWIRAHWNTQSSVLRYPIGRQRLAADPGPGEDVVFVGRLEYRKGIDTLLRAWSGLEGEHRLHLVGDDCRDERTGSAIGANLLEVMPAGARARVMVHGRLGPERVAAMQAGAAVVIVPSPDDNFPYTCIEAMHAGRIVVAADRGGAAEMIEHGTSGLLFDPGDAEGLAAALRIALVMHDEQRSAMQRAAIDRIHALTDGDAAIDARLAHLATVATAEPGSGLPRTLDGIVAEEIRQAEARHRNPWRGPDPITGGPAMRTGLAVRVGAGRTPFIERVARRVKRTLGG
ncbi:MAG: glycosyltransferase family 4 protein [Planctomycetota bacterium]